VSKTVQAVADGEGEAGLPSSKTLRDSRHGCSVPKSNYRSTMWRIWSPFFLDTNEYLHMVLLHHSSQEVFPKSREDVGWRRCLSLSKTRVDGDEEPGFQNLNLP
jgi:hypothetical protein